MTPWINELSKDTMQSYWDKTKIVSLESLESSLQETRNGFEMAEEEINRLEALPVQGEQSCMVQSDMKKWNQKEGNWPQMAYRNMIVLHAIDRGWLQPNFTGMEIVE